MIGFWIMAVLILLAAYALFAPALLGKHSAAAIDRRRLNLMLHSQRRDELAAESAGSELAGLQAELDKDLLGDLSAAEQAAATPNQQGRAALIVALIAAPLLGLLVYSMIGRLDLANFRAEPVAAAKKTGSPEFQEMIDRLAERLKTDGKDVNSWMLLGRTYLQTEQYDKAVDTLSHALQLAPDNIDLKAAYAEALGESLGGEFTGEPAKIAAEILAVNPKHRNALWLAGAGAAQSGETPGAIAYLERLRAEFPKDSPDDKNLSKIIGELKGAGQSEPAETTGAAAAELPATGEQKAIQVKVALAPALKSKAAPDDVVFIFAKAASGPPMPLAIVRKKVKELPVEVTLDDSMAMVQGMNLSAFDQLILGARISKTGQALPKPGDLQGLSKPTAIQNGEHYSVEISEEVK